MFQVAADRPSHQLGRGLHICTIRSYSLIYGLTLAFRTYNCFTSLQHYIHFLQPSSQPLCGYKMSTSEVFQQFFVKLIKILPMDDPLFTAELFTCDLLPGNLKQKIEAKETRVDKATCFLDDKISLTITTQV